MMQPEQDNILMPIRGEGLQDDNNDNDDGGDAATTGGQGSSKAADKVVYVLHPNCAVEEV